MPNQKPMFITDHWLSAARKTPSPNCSERPAGGDISLLVIHNISLPPGEFGGPHIDELFCNGLRPEGHPFFQQISHLRVSAHLLIRRDGELVQYVPFNEQAWHAGKSEFAGRQACNEFSIGIELEGTDECPFTPVQYERLAAVSRVLMNAYPAILPTRIAGHSEIAPDRKTDPGPYFDWQEYRNAL